MADAGYHCFAPDWIGFGFSDMPQPGYGFDYTEEEFHKSLDELLSTLNITEPFFLVVQVHAQNIRNLHFHNNSHIYFLNRFFHFHSRDFL
jgi:hypothetical protein